MSELSPTERLRKAWRARQVTWLASGLIVCVLVWALFAQLDQVVVAQGQMIPTRTVQKIQSLEGGILKSMLVEEGQMVEAGQPLLELDDTRFRASVEEAGQSIRGLEAAQARLQAELASVAIDNGDVLVSPVPMAEPATPSPGWESERAALAGRLASLQGRLFQADRRVEQQRQIQQEAQRNLRTQQQSLALQRQDLQALESAVNDGVLPISEFRQAKRDQVALKGEVDRASLQIAQYGAALQQAIAERRSIAAEFRAESQAELIEVETRLAQAQEKQPALQDQLTRTTMVAPLRGIVKNIAFRSLGGVIRPGEAIMEIVPVEDALIAEARVSPKDIAWVKAGLDTQVKFSAYDFTSHGGMPGQVEYVSADVLRDEEDNPYYRVKVALQGLSQPDQPIMPGMQVTIDIMTGKRTVMSYWLKPLLRARQTAMREP